MDIGFIHPSWPGDEGTGATYSATQVVTGLAARGHRVTVFCSSDLPPNLNPPSGMELEPIDGRGWPYHSNSQLNRAIKSSADRFEEFDIVNCYLPAGLPGMEYVGRETSTATGVTLNAYGAVCPKNDLLYRGEEQCDERSLTRCTRCIAATSAGHDEFSAPYRAVSQLGNLRLVRKGARDLEAIDCFRAPSGHVKENHVDFGFSKERIQVIPHPLDEDFLIEHRSDFIEPYRLLYVGYLEVQKGVEKLIPVLSAVRERLDAEVTLTVVGRGGRRSDMEAQAQRHGLTGAVDFRGFVPNSDLPEVYASHDLFVYPGVWEEPLGRVFLEALATGTPIVSSRYGSIESIIGAGGVTAPGEVSDLASAIVRVARENRFRVLSRDGKQEAQRYLLDDIILDIEAMYENAVA